MLFGDRAKAIGLICGILFATLLMAQQSSIFVSLLNRTANQINDVYEANIWVMDPRMKFFDEVEPLPDTALGRIRGVPGVQWAVPFHTSQVVARSTDGLLQAVRLIGIDDNTLIGAPINMVVGKIEDLKQPNAIILDLAGYQFLWPNQPITAGRVLELNDHRAIIVGVADNKPPFQTTPVVFTQYSNAMGFIGQTRKQLSYVLVKSQPGTSPHQITAAISQQTGLQALTKEEFTWKTIQYILQRTGIPINFGITIALGFIVGAAITGQTFYLFMTENLKQFAALKAIGVTNGVILRMVMLQGLVVGTIGYSLGIALAAIFFTVTKDAPALKGFAMHWQIAGIVIGAVMLIIMLSAAISVRKALTTDPAIVFRG